MVTRVLVVGAAVVVVTVLILGDTVEQELATVGVEQLELVDISFCLTSLIFSWRHTLLGKTELCLVWN